MKGFASVFLGCCLVMPFVSISLGTQENWYTTSSGAGWWEYRKPIVIQASKVVGDLTNFSVLISITDTDLRDSAQLDGDDICFVNADNTLKLDHEIEQFDASTGALVAWVRIPFLSSTANTMIYLYYGRSDCDSQENPTGVWDSHYKLVQHLEETAGTLYDSTSNNNDGTPEGGISQNTTGKIDGADYFDGVDDCVGVEDADSLNPTLNMTAEAWVQCNAVIDAHWIIGKGYPWYPDQGGYHLDIVVFEGGFHWRFGVRIGDAERAVPSTDVIQLNQWCYVVGTYNGSNVNIYVNGTLSNSYIHVGEMEIDYDPLFIGALEPALFYFNGTIDEVRISDAARDAGWIETCYNTMNNPSQFSIAGAQQSNPAQPIPESPTYALLPILFVSTLFAVLVLRRKRVT